MNNILTSIWSDEAGFVLSAELVLVSTVAGFGVLAGLSQVRSSLIEEYDDLAESVSSLDQSYSYGGFKGCKSFTAGSAYYEDGREVEIEFTEIYQEKSCVKPAPCMKPEVCPPQQQFIIEPLPGPEFSVPCNNCLNVPEAKCDSCSGGVEYQGEIAPLSAPCATPSCLGARPQGTCQDFASAKVFGGIGQYGQYYQGVDGNPQKVFRPYENSVYNVKRYIETPYFPNAPLSGPRSTVW